MNPSKFFSILIGALLPVMVMAQDAPRPNIVFIIADDLGWADVAFHGGTAPTPNLDALAQQNLELTAHYVAPVCSPTRTGLLTGRCWSRFGITTPTNERALPWDTITLARALQSVGYETCLVGKWHLGSAPDWGPNHYGFDHSYGSLAGGVSPWNHRYKKGPYSVTWHRNEELLEETGHVTDLLTDEAVAWIDSRGEDPFFLYVPYTAVHLPLKEPEEWVQQVPEAITGEVDRHYAASVMHLDDAVGRVLRALEDKGVRENTLLVFTSDNGGSTAENNDLKYPDDNCPNGKLPGNNLPYRGKKGDVYEGGVRVPTIVSWPSSIPSGANDTPVFICDWMPTFCSLAGFKADQDLEWDGTDLTNVLLKGDHMGPRPIYLAGPRHRANALRYADWKLVATQKGDAYSYELYNLAEYPSETANLAAKNPDKVTELREMLEAATKADGDSVVND